MQNGGVFLGMLAVGIACTGFKFGALKNWVWAGCMGSCISLILIALAGQSPEIAPLVPLVPKPLILLTNIPNNFKWWV